MDSEYEEAEQSFESHNLESYVIRRFLEMKNAGSIGVVSQYDLSQKKWST